MSAKGALSRVAAWPGRLVYPPPQPRCLIGSRVTLDHARPFDARHPRGVLGRAYAYRAASRRSDIPVTRGFECAQVRPHKLF